MILSLYTVFIYTIIKDKGTETEKAQGLHRPNGEKKMRVTIKKSKLSSYGRIRWELSINGKPVIMARQPNGEIWLTWCDKDFDICTVKMFPGAPLYETKALLKALSYTL